MQKWKQNQGVTLLEILLVLVIAASLVLLGIQQYTSYQRYQELDQVRYSVDLLFQAAANFYRANCIEYLDASGTIIKPGRLDPESVVPEPPKYKLDIYANLWRDGFINEWPFPDNAYVRKGVDQYVVQFVKTYSDRTQEMSDTTIQTIGRIPVLKIQIAVRLSTTAATDASTYEKVLGATCVGGKSGLFVECGSDPKDYLIWERLPSLGSPGIASDLWPTLHTVDQFTQMYTTYPITSLTSGAVANQLFLCTG